jgi:hypothetical protein
MSLSDSEEPRPVCEEVRRGGNFVDDIRFRPRRQTPRWACFSGGVCVRGWICEYPGPMHGFLQPARLHRFGGPFLPKVVSFGPPAWVRAMSCRRILRLGSDTALGLTGRGRTDGLKIQWHPPARPHPYRRRRESARQRAATPSVHAVANGKRWRVTRT